jgi:hypothetical protein
MIPPPIKREVLTGKFRVRPQRFTGLLILQVQLQIETAPAFSTIMIPLPPNKPESVRGEWEETERDRVEKVWRPAGTRWRDALWDDVVPGLIVRG